MIASIVWSSVLDIFLQIYGRCVSNSGTSTEKNKSCSILFVAGNSCSIDRIVYSYLPYVGDCSHKHFASDKSIELYNEVCFDILIVIPSAAINL